MRLTNGTKLGPYEDIAPLTPKESFIATLSQLVFL